MRKVKIIILIVVIAVAVLFVTQNQAYFQQRHRLAFDSFVLEPISLPELPNLVYFCICLGAGVLFTWLATLLGRFRMRKELKTLRQRITSQQVTIDTLNRELVEAKAIPAGVETEASALGSSTPEEATTTPKALVGTTPAATTPETAAPTTTASVETGPTGTDTV